MRKATFRGALLAGAALAVMLGGPALAQECTQKLDQIEAQLGQGDMSEQDRTDVKKMTEAARTLAETGNKDECMQVVTDIERFFNVGPGGAAGKTQEAASQESGSQQSGEHRQQQASQGQQQAAGQAGQQGGQQQQALGQDDQALEQVQQSVDQARHALQQDDKQKAQDALKQADQKLQQAMQQAQGQQKQSLQQVQKSVDQAKQAVQQGDMQKAEQALQGIDQPIQQAQQQGGGQQQAAGQAGQQGGQQQQAQGQQQTGQQGGGQQQSAGQAGQQGGQSTTTDGEQPDQGEQMAATPESPLAQMRADEVIGQDVVNANGEAVGEISGLVIDNRDVVYAIVGVGGFLGIAEKDVAIPFDQLQLGGNNIIMMSEATEDQLQEQPAYEEGSYQDLPSNQPIGDAATQ